MSQQILIFILTILDLVYSACVWNYQYDDAICYHIDFTRITGIDDINSCSKECLSGMTIHQILYEEIAISFSSYDSSWGDSVCYCSPRSPQSCIKLTKTGYTTYFRDCTTNSPTTTTKSQTITTTTATPTTTTKSPTITTTTDTPTTTTTSPTITTTTATSTTTTKSPTITTTTATPTTTTTKSPTITSQPITSSTTVSPLQPTSMSISPSNNCNDIVVEIIDLYGVSTYDVINTFISNTTYYGVKIHAIDYGITNNVFNIKYKSVSGFLNITESVCCETEQILKILKDVIVEQSFGISQYIKNKIIKQYEENYYVSTKNMLVNIYWKDDESIGDVSNISTAENRRKIFEIPSLYITVGILGVFFLFAMVSLFDAKCCRKNDYFSAICIIMASFEVSDTILDLLFATLLIIHYDINKDIQFLIAGLAAYFFVVLPITYSICELLIESKKNWLLDNELSGWLTENGKILFLLSILTGSSYTAIEIVNCGAFKLEIFSMGLNKQQRIIFDRKRVIGMICLENIEQIIIQIWYLSKFGADFIPILSIVFSFISIIITVLQIYTQREISKKQKPITIEFDIIGDDVDPKLSTKTNGIKSEISRILGIHHNLLEIPKPKIISNGLKIEVNLFLNDIQQKNINYKSKINTADNNIKLSNFIQNEWKLKKQPIIMFILENNGNDTIELMQQHQYQQKDGYTSVHPNEF